MASSKKPRSGDLAASVGDLLQNFPLARKRVAVGLSGGLDSVTLLHVLKGLQSRHGFVLRAVHVHHGLSPNADTWTKFCRTFCKRLGVPLTVRRVKVSRGKDGLEAAARRARYAAFENFPCDYLLLAHQLDDQAETVLMNLLRGTGGRGASGMPASAVLGAGRKRKSLLRPLLGVSRATIGKYARVHGLQWVEDESNDDEALTRNFVRRRIAPMFDSRFPRWRESFARAARHFARKEIDAGDLLRQFLAGQGLRAPSEAKLIEMLKQLTAKGSRTLLEHDGATLRTYRGKVLVSRMQTAKKFTPVDWRGEPRLQLPALGGEMRFKRARGRGIAFDSSAEIALTLSLRRGGERLQPDARRPRRTLKNLFQEAGIPAWERERLPMLFCGEDLVWVPGLGVDARYQADRDAEGIVPEWRR
jgi:tRNA(Ile)-lysidine synthase